MVLLVVLCFVSLFQEYQMCMEYGGFSVEIAKLSGQWWEYQAYNTHHLMDPYDHDCFVANFYPKGDGLVVIEDFIQRVPGMENKEHSRREWWMDRVRGSKSVLYTGITSVAGKIIEYTYTVVGTDYENYLIAAICGDDENFNSIYRAAYVMTKGQSLSDEDVAFVEAKVRATLKQFPKTISKRRAYTTKKNDNCKPVIFPQAQSL